VRDRLNLLAVAGLVVVCLFPNVAAADTGADVEMFTRDGCPYCAAALDFLGELQRERPALRIVVRDVRADQAARDRLVSLAAEHGIEQLGVPAFHVRGRLLIGFGGAETTGAALKALLDAPRADGRAGSSRGAGEHEAVAVPFLGPVRVRDLGLPLFTVVLGLLDGFNPCAMWVLLFVLSLLVNLRDRRKMAVIGATFVLVSGVVYFTFMAAWLNLFFLVGVSRSTQVVLAVIAGVIGALNVKDAAAIREGPSLSIPASVRPGIYARVRAIVTAESLASALAGVIVLAVLVNVIELLCTAGLPALYTRILTLHELPAWQYYAYLALYNTAYVLDDGAVLALAVVTLSRYKLQERGGRWLKLVSGAVMLGLAFVLIIRPAWLAG
jgi:glutaredoxin